MGWDAAEASFSSAGLSGSAGLLAGGLSAGAAAARGGGGGKAAEMEMEMAGAGAGVGARMRPRPGFSSGVELQSNMKSNMKPVTSCPSLGELGGGAGGSVDRRSRR